jgi:hypothetical protein
MERPTAEQLSKVIVIALFLGMTGAFAFALILTTTISPGTILVLLGALLIVAFATFLLTIIFRRVEHFLKIVPKYSWFQAPRLPKSRTNDHLVSLTGRVLAGAIFHMGAYLFYITVLAIFFFVLGDPFSSTPAYLLWAAFSGALIVRLSRYVPHWAERIAGLIADFLIPFGFIAALALWLKFGGSITSPQLVEIAIVYGPLIFMLFPFYLLADATFQFLRDRGFLRTDLSSAIKPNDK